MATEKRLIDANALLSELEKFENPMPNKSGYDFLCGVATAITEIENASTVDAVEVVHGRWLLTATKEHSNYRWNVTAECSECHHSKGEIYAGFFPGVPEDLARDIILDNAESVKLDNYCPNCGAKMDL